MKGIQFIVNDRGEKTAAVIDLQQWGEEWETFYSQLLDRPLSDESWLHQTPFSENLDRALEWNLNNAPQTTNLEELETQLQNNG